MKKFISAVHHISYFLSWIATGALFFMVVITTIDVFARYLFNNPILGSNELVECGMVVFVYGAMAHATIARTHVCANIVDPLLSKRHGEILGAFAFIIAGITFFLMTWRTSLEATATIRNMQEHVTLTLRIPTGPLYIFITIGLFMLCIEIIFDVIHRFRDAKTTGKVMTKNQKDEVEEALISEGMI